MGMAGAWLAMWPVPGLLEPFFSQQQSIANNANGLFRKPLRMCRSHGSTSVKIAAGSPLSIAQNALITLIM
jgi:hypothetical protein